MRGQGRARIRGIQVLLVVVGCLGAACATTGPSDVGRIDLTVFAAASLRDATQAAIAAYAEAEPDVTITLSTDSSATLRTQIEQGAPADVFLSADTDNPRRLVDLGMTEGTAVDFATNVPVIIVPAANPARIGSPADLARPGVKMVAAGDDVPIARYAAEVVRALAALPGYPPGFAAAVGANVVSNEANVTAVLTKIELGEGDAGIVYRTDARGSDAVVVVPIPSEVHVTATYAGVVLLASREPREAAAFLDWLAKGDGRAVLDRFGFLGPSPG